MSKAARAALTLRRPAPRAEELRQRGDLLWIEPKLLTPDPEQPRKTFDEASLAQLADSIAEEGVLTPLRVRPPDPQTGIYIITDGERRWRVSERAGVAEFPCLVEAADQRRAHLEAFITSIHRDELTPVDAAVALQHVREGYGLASDDEVAAKVHKSLGWVRQMRAILELDPESRRIIQERREPAAVALSLRPQAPAERRQTLEAIEDMPGGRDAKVDFISRVNEQRRSGAPIETAIEVARATSAPPSVEAQPPRDDGPRKRVGRPQRITFPFVWREVSGVKMLDVNPGALATTRLAVGRTANLQAWLDAVRSDLVAFRDACADGPDSDPTWSDAANALSAVLTTQTPEASTKSA